ncbi:MAG TPA: hypothetical protein VKB34_13465, partial [Povalibacter sp.]|nr:hypothetical protein [Povalibacter sp.]
PASGVDEDITGYLRKAHVNSELRYAGCPGHTTARIAEEERLRPIVEQAMRTFDPPRGRRTGYLQTVWSSLDHDTKEQILAAPVPPKRRANGALNKLRNLLADWTLRVVGVAGLVALVLVILQTAGWTLPARLVPPPAVVAGTWLWAKWLTGIVVTLALVSIVARLAAIPRHAAGRFAAMYRRKWIVGTIGVALRALPALIALLGIVALFLWHGRTFVRAIAWLLPWLFWILIAVATIALLWLTVLCLNRRRETVQEMRWDANQLQRIARICEREEHGPQNHLAGITTIKSTPLRLWTLRIALRWLNLIIPLGPGLGGISSIHFAHWTLLPKEKGTRQRRLLFVSNYDGGWGGYLGEFVAKVARGVTSIWGNTGGFPQHTFFFGGGASDEQRFKSYARASQVETLLWYRRYRNLSKHTIERNAAIRAELAGFARRFAHVPNDITEAQVDTFLRRF